MSLPVLSICIPAYKRPGHLTRLLESVAMQSFKNYEVVITDDSPGNELRDIVNRFSQLPIRYFKNERQLGSPANWNEAIRRSTTEWVQLMHSDDWYALEGSLQRFAETAQTTSSKFIFSASREIGPSPDRVKPMGLDKEKRRLLENPVNLLYDNVIGHPSVLIYKKDPGLQYDTAYKWVVDIDFYIRYLQKHGDYYYIDEPLVHIGVDETMISHTSYKNPAVEIPEYLDLFGKFPPALPRTHPYAFYSLWKLLKKFRIRHENELKGYGWSGKEIEGIEFILDCQKKIPHIILKQTGPSDYFMKRCYRKFIRQPRHSSS